MNGRSKRERGKDGEALPDWVQCKVWKRREIDPGDDAEARSRCRLKDSARRNGVSSEDRRCRKKGAREAARGSESASVSAMRVRCRKYEGSRASGGEIVETTNDASLLCALGCGGRHVGGRHPSSHANSLPT